MDEAREFRDGEVGALAGAIDGEESQADGVNAVERGVVRAHLLARHLRHGIRADGLEDGVGLGEGNFFVHAID